MNDLLELAKFNREIKKLSLWELMRLRSTISKLMNKGEFESFKCSDERWRLQQIYKDKYNIIISRLNKLDPTGELRVAKKAMYDSSINRGSSFRRDSIR